jgi:hypothetical protein
MSQTAPITPLGVPTTGEDRTREQIEQAVIGRPFCEACGSVTVPVAEGDDIWLACASTQVHRPVLRRILSLEPLIGHTRRMVIDGVSERLAA